MTTYLQQAIAAGYARLDGEGKNTRIRYIAVNHSERYSDAEEVVRAEFWAELIFRYGYEPHRIGVEIIIPDRTPHDAADLIIFEDDERKRPFAVIECKQDGISDKEFEQAVEQAFGNGNAYKFHAKYVMVVAGLTRRAFDLADEYGALERERNIIADLPRQYGKPEEYKYHKGGALDIQPVSREALSATIRKAHQSLWGAGQRSAPQAFSELCKIIFVKISDETKKRKVGEPYEFQIKTHETSARLAARIRALYARERERDPNVFTDNINVDDSTLSTVVSHFEGLNLSRTDLDTKGVAFEQFMDGFFKGSFGQYFTPRELIQFAVEMLRVTNDDKVIDPACGSGGFLLYALDAVRREADEYYPDHESDPFQRQEHYAHWHTFAMTKLYGIEINDDIARVAKMNMIIHDDGHTNVIGRDALDPFDALQKENPQFVDGSFDVVLTNPPFGGEAIKISARTAIAEDFELANQITNGRERPRNNQKPEILYIERIWQFLKPGVGRAAIILPDGVLSNSSLQYVRDWMLAHFQIKAVVSLPQFAFAHYGAGVKASILFVRKRAVGEPANDDTPIFMAAPEKIGYDATGRKTPNQLADVLAQYRAFEENPDPFFAALP
jgi:type I restriction enzyme M protein